LSTCKVIGFLVSVHGYLGRTSLWFLISKCMTFFSSNFQVFFKMFLYIESLCLFEKLVIALANGFLCYSKHFFLLYKEVLVFFFYWGRVGHKEANLACVH
jgi:hypothetical protein